MPTVDAAQIRSMYLAGQRRWPLLAVSFEDFAAHYGKVANEGEGVPLEPADLYLCCACIAALPAALRSFETYTAGVAEAAIRRIHDDRDFVRDCLQELWNRVLLGDHAKLRSYSGRGPLQAWVRVAATRVALDRRRADKRYVKREVQLSERLAASGVSVEAGVLKARFGRAFQEALRGAVACLSEQERNVLRMHVVGRCSIDEIGLAYDVHRATAARWIERARARIYDEVRRELCVDHKLTLSEFRSLAALLGPELELSLGFGSATAARTRTQKAGDTA